MLYYLYINELMGFLLSVYFNADNYLIIYC